MAGEAAGSGRRREHRCRRRSCCCNTSLSDQTTGSCSCSRYPEEGAGSRAYFWCPLEFHSGNWSCFLLNAMRATIFNIFFLPSQWIIDGRDWKNRREPFNFLFVSDCKRTSWLSGLTRGSISSVSSLRKGQKSTLVVLLAHRPARYSHLSAALVTLGSHLPCWLLFTRVILKCVIWELSFTACNLLVLSQSGNVLDRKINITSENSLSCY